MIQEPSRAQHAGFLGGMNADVVMMELDIITDTATKRTGGIIDYLEGHQHSWWTSQSLVVLRHPYRTAGR
jgi:hypothetical protein